MGKRQHDIDHPRHDTSRSITSSAPAASPARNTARSRATASAARRATTSRRDTSPPDWKKSPLEYFLDELDHRPLPDRPAGSDLRPVQGRRDRHGADEQRARRQAGAQPVHQERADVRQLPHDQPAGARQAADSRRSVRRRRTRSSRPRTSNGSTAQYQNEFGTPNPKAQSCQDCHMPRRLHERVARHRRPADPDAHRDRRGRHLSGRGAPRAARRHSRPLPRGGFRPPRAARPERLPARDVQAVQRRARRAQERLHDRHVRQPRGRAGEHVRAGAHAHGHGRSVGVGRRGASSRRTSR